MSNEKGQTMKHVCVATKAPARAADVPPNVLIEFIIAMLAALEPILLAKNPLPTT